MQSTIAASYSKQADINQPRHMTPRVTSSHPAINGLISAGAIWEARCFKQLQPEVFKTRVITQAQMKRTLHTVHRKISLSFHPSPCCLNGKPDVIWSTLATAPL